MSRRRRGQRRPWGGGDGQPGGPRTGADGRGSGHAPRDDYATAIPAPSRWLTSAGGGQRPRRPDDVRTRWSVEAAKQRQRATGGGRPNGSGQRFTPRPPRSGAPSQQQQPHARPRPAGHEPRRADTPVAAPAGVAIDPFDLFCAYHLGITSEDGYRIQNIHEVARRFGTNAAALRQTLTAYGMDADDIVHSGFDLASAQLDIMVAPTGISRRELARPLFEEFRAAPRRTRDWAREMDQAERQIESTIGRDGRWSPGPRDPAGKQS